MVYVFYCILGIFGGLAGLRLAVYFQNYFPFIKDNISFFSGLGLFIGMLLAPLFARLFKALIDLAIRYLQGLSLQEIVLGAIGLIFGLVIATLLILVLSFIPFSSIPVVGEYIGPFLYVIMALFWIYLGVFLATRLSTLKSFRLFLSDKKDSVEEKNYKILDTSAIIDGRIYDVCKANFLEGTVVVPKFILDEIHKLSDSSDPIKRNRGRRGLNLLNKLKNELNIEFFEKDYNLPTDEKLIQLSRELKGTIVTTDYNLGQVASFQKIRALNLNELASSLKQIILPGEEIKVNIVKEGKERDQGVAYLEDGTMIVVEEGRKLIGNKVKVEITSILQTVAGKMFFARPIEVNSK